MKPALVPDVKKLILLLTLLAGVSAHADNDYRGALAVLNEQLAVLAHIGGPSCPRNFPGQYRNISVFFGYGNFADRTFDQVMAKAFVGVLKKRCAPRIAACGFKEIHRQNDLTVLRKNGVTLKIISTSISPEIRAHLDPNGLFWDQEKHSGQVRGQFYRDLVLADAVFFLGHSRGGGGLGFNISNDVVNAFNYVFRIPVLPMKNALAQRPSNLKMLGLFGCDTNKYYRADVESVAPHVSLMVSDGDLDFYEGPQAMLGALNSLLARKCTGAFHESLRGSRAERQTMYLLLR